jgi:hypothetical protein
MRQRWLLLLVSLALVVGVVGFAPVGVTRAAPNATTYTWNQTGAAAWGTASNWTPARNTPAVDDILVFDGFTTPAPTVTGVPKQTLGQLKIINNATVTFASGTATTGTGTISRSGTTVTGVGTSFTTELAVGDVIYGNITLVTYDVTSITSNTTLNTAQSSTVTSQGFSIAPKLTISGGSSDDLVIEAGSSLTINTSTLPPIVISVGTGATGNISGNMTFQGGLHRLITADANSVTFNTGTTFTQGTNCTGNVFGSTGAANVIVFAAGSTFVSQAGSAPFGLGQPNSKVVFQTGSLYRHEQASIPSFSGRTYANFEWNINSAQSGSGAAALSIDNLTVSQGSLSVGMTGAFNLKGNVSVASGATLNFNSASAAAITLSGSAQQTISNAGTLTFGPNESLSVSSNGAKLLSNATFGGAALALNGDIDTNGNILTLGNSATTTGSGDVVGNVQRTAFVAGTTYSFGNPNVAINFASATTLPTDVTVTLGKTRPAGFTYSITRTYSIVQTGGVGFLAVLRLHYLDSELNLANGATEANLHLFKNISGTWIDQGKSGNDATANWVEQSGIDSFSEWTLSGNSTTTAITLTTFSGRTPSNNGWIVLILLAAAGLLIGGWALHRRTQL